MEAAAAGAGAQDNNDAVVDAGARLAIRAGMSDQQMQHVQQAVPGFKKATAHQRRQHKRKIVGADHMVAVDFGSLKHVHVEEFAYHLDTQSLLQCALARDEQFSRALAAKCVRDANAKLHDPLFEKQPVTLCLSVGSDAFKPDSGGIMAGTQSHPRLMLVSAVLLSLVRGDLHAVLHTASSTAQTANKRIPIALARVSKECDEMTPEFIGLLQPMIDELCGMTTYTLPDDGGSVDVAMHITISSDLSLAQSLSGTGGRACPWCDLTSGQWRNPNNFFRFVTSPLLKPDAPTLLMNFGPPSFAPDYGLHDSLNQTSFIVDLYTDLAKRSVYDEVYLPLQTLLHQLPDQLKQQFKTLLELQQKSVASHNKNNQKSLMDLKEQASVNLQKQHDKRNVAYVPTRSEIDAYAAVSWTDQQRNGHYKTVVEVFMTAYLKTPVGRAHDAGIRDCKMEYFTGSKSERVAAKALADRALAHVQHIQRPNHVLRAYLAYNKSVQVTKKGSQRNYGYTGAASKLVLRSVYSDGVESEFESVLPQMTPFIRQRLTAIGGYVERSEPLYAVFRNTTPILVKSAATPWLSTVDAQFDAQVVADAIQNVRSWRQVQLPDVVEKDYAHIESHAPWWIFHAAGLGVTIGALSSSGVEMIQQRLKRNCAKCSGTVQPGHSIVEQLIRLLMCQWWHGMEDGVADDASQLEQQQAQPGQPARKKKKSSGAAAADNVLSQQRANAVAVLKTQRDKVLRDSFQNFTGQ